MVVFVPHLLSPLPRWGEEVKIAIFGRITWSDCPDIQEKVGTFNRKLCYRTSDYVLNSKLTNFLNNSGDKVIEFLPCC